MIKQRANHANQRRKPPRKVNTMEKTDARTVSAASSSPDAADAPPPHDRTTVVEVITVLPRTFLSRIIRRTTHTRCELE